MTGDTFSMLSSTAQGRMAAWASILGWDNQLLALETKRPLVFVPKSRAHCPTITLLISPLKLIFFHCKTQSVVAISLSLK